MKIRENTTNYSFDMMTGAKSLDPMPELNLVLEAPSQAGGDLHNEIEYLSAAWMLTVGLSADQIEEALNLPPGYVATLRSNGKFRVILRRCLELKAQSAVANAADPEELFNSQILDSALALMNVRDDPFERGSSRVKAAKEFLDRAPKAPKVRKEIEQHQTIITLPISALQNMQRALLEEGSPRDLETIELLEGADYIVDNRGDNGGREGQISVERVE